MTFINGWFHTGDLANIDEDGYIQIVDRLKDIVISGGENISTFEVENAIYTHPAVLECAVVAAPHEIWGETPAALVVLKEGQSLEPQELINFVGERIARYKKPQYVEFIPDLPLSQDGLPDRAKIKEKYGGKQ